MDEVQQIFTGVMSYDALAHRGSPTQTLPTLYAWLDQHPEAWRLERRGLEHVGTPGQSITVLLGEAGTGKTTLLDTVERQFSSNNSFLTVRIDFTHAVMLMGSVRQDQAEQRIAHFLRDCTEASVRAQRGPNRWTQYQSARIRYILESRAHASLNRVRSACDPAAMSDGELLGSDLVTNSIAEYDSQQADTFTSIQAVQMIPGVRTMLLFDNVDKLEPWLVRMVLAKVSAIVHNDTIALIAVRNEHERATDVLTHARPVKTERMHEDHTSLMQIARIRAEGAYRLTVATNPEWSPEAAVRRDAIFGALDAVEENPDLLRLATAWLNGDLRHSLRLLTELSIELRAAEYRPNSLNGLVFSRLVKRNAPKGLLDVVRASRVRTETYKDLPFVFLPLRVLTYMRLNGGSVSRSEMASDFRSHFGISEGTLRQTLNRLSDAEGAPRMVRLTTDRNSAGVAVLMPCGYAFVEVVVYSCDYLAFVYDNMDGMRALSSSARSRTEIKFAKALEVVEAILLPSFTLEHPYIAEGRDIRPREQVRLASYQEMFNYGARHWFVARLHETLKSYARSRGLHSADWTRVSSKLQRAAERLDTYAAG